MVKVSILLSRSLREGPTDKVTFEQRPMGTGSEPRGSLRENRPAEDQHVDRPEAGRR